MSMEKIDETTLRRLQKKYGFKLCRIKGTGMVVICKRMDSNKYKQIDIDEFGEVLKKRKLAVYRGQNDFLKIMKE